MRLLCESVFEGLRNNDGTQDEENYKLIEIPGLVGI
jgi:hypothetical protein